MLHGFIQKNIQTKILPSSHTIDFVTTAQRLRKRGKRGHCITGNPYTRAYVVRMGRGGETTALLDFLGINISHVKMRTIKSRIVCKQKNFIILRGRTLASILSGVQTSEDIDWFIIYFRLILVSPEMYRSI